MVEETARQMTWHKIGKRTELDADGNLMMVRTSGGEAWKRFDALHDDKAVIQKDSIEEYELLAKQGGGYPGFISWFKKW